MCAGDEGLCGCGAGSDGAIVWNASKGGCEAFLQGHAAGMRWVSIADQGKRLVTASADSEIKKWNIDTATCLDTLPGLPALPVLSLCMRKVFVQE